MTTCESQYVVDDLVNRIHTGGDEGAIARLEPMLAPGIRFYLRRLLGSRELENREHEIFEIAVQAIQFGEVRDQGSLARFVLETIRLQTALHCESAPWPRNDPEKMAGKRRGKDEKTDLMRTVLADLCSRDREALTRFYLNLHSEQTISEESDLTLTQFRELRRRTKFRFAFAASRLQA
jgi:hypothetical protein